MNGVIIATLGGIATLILWGMSDWLTGKSSRWHSVPETNVAIRLPGAVIMLLILLVSGLGWPNLGQLIVLLLGAVFFTIAYICFIRALAVGETGVVVPLVNGYPLVTLVLVTGLLAVPFGMAQILAMLVIIAGAVLLGAEKTRKRRAGRHFGKGVKFSLAAAASWGLAFFIIETVVDELPWPVIVGVLALATGAAALGWAVASRPKQIARLPKRIAGDSGAVLAGIVLTLGDVALFSSAAYAGSLLIPAVIAAASPLMTEALAAFYDQETLSVAKRAGGLLVVLGVVVLNVG